MADTTLELDAGSGGATLAVDDIAGAVYQYVGMTYGGSGSKTAVSNTNPMPAKITDGTDTALVTAAGELHVSNITALPAGTNNIGDVDVLSVVPGTGATNLGKAEDAAHSSGDVGVMALSVRQDTAAALGQTDADYQPLITDGSGRLHVNVGNTVAVSGTVDLGATDNGVLDAIAASVAAIDTDTTTLIGHVDGIETLIRTTNTTLTTIDGRVDGIEGLLGTTNTNTGNAATSLAIMDDWDNGASDGASVSGDVAHDAADAGEPVKIGGYAKASAPTDVSADGDRVNAWFDLAGRQAIFDGGLALSIDDGGNTITVDGTVAVTNAGITTIAGAVSGSEMQVDVVTMPTVTVNAHAVTNAGTFVVQENGAALTSLQLLDDTVATTGAAVVAKGILAAGTDGTNARALKTDASGELQVDILSIAAGTNAIGKLAANSGVDIGDVDVTSISAGTNLIGDVGIQGRTTGGLSIFRSIDLDETEEEIKGSAGTLYSILAFNRTAAPLYLKFYDNTAAGTTVGSTTPVMTFVVPANADSDGAGFTHACTQGYAFSTGITAAATTAIADADTGAPGANDCVIVVGYK